MNVNDETIPDKINHDYQSVESYRFVNNFHDIAANTALGITDGIYVPPTPSSTTYFTSWQGTITNRALENQMNSVIKYFNNLGYKLERLTNSATGKTFKWHIYW